MRTLKRGQKYHIDCVVGDRRMRCSLGTQDPKAATRLRNRLEFAIADGPNSKVWAEIQPILPPLTYKRISHHVGVPKQVSLTWDELSSIFRTRKEKSWAKSTARGYDRVLRGFGDFLNQHEVFRVKDITRSVVADYQAAAEELSLTQPQYRNGAGVYGDMGMLGFVFKFAVEEGLMESNPVRREKSTHVARETQPYTAEELGRLRLFAEGPDMMTFQLLRWSGLRASDAVALRWSSINWTNQEIRSVNLKTGKEVVIPIHAELLQHLEANRPTDDHNFILDVQDPGALYRRCQKLGELAKVKNCRPHRFRDSLAIDMLLRGASLFDVSKVLGNTVSVVEAHYSPFVPALRSKVRQILSDDEKGLEARCE